MNITIIKVILGFHVFGTLFSARPTFLTIRGCNNELAEIYVDKEYILPAVNPVLTDTHGNYNFYTTAKCVTINGAEPLQQE